MSTCSRGAKDEAREDAAHRLGEAARRVYCVAGIGVGKAAVPGRRAAECVGGEAVDRRTPPASAENAMKQNDQQAVVGAAAFGDRHDRQPGRSRPAAACRRRPAPRTTGASASITDAGKDARQQAEHGQDAHRGSEKRSTSLRRPPPRCAGGRGRRCRTRARNRPRPAPPPAPAARPTAGIEQLQRPLRQRGPSRIAWNSQPFRDEAVERRQGRDGQRSRSARTRPVAGMRWIRPPSRSMSRSPVARQHRAGAEEQQALEQGMVERRGAAPRSCASAAAAPCRWP